jgi:hypothetical protein
MRSSEKEKDQERSLLTAIRPEDLALPWVNYLAFVRSEGNVLKVFYGSARKDCKRL